MHEVTEEVKTNVKLFKPFLVKLYVAESKYKKNQVLAAASDQELSLLIKILHFLSWKEIHIAKSRKEALLKTKRLSFIVAHFKADSSVTKLLASPRSEQLRVLKKVGLFNHLLHAMLYED
jgi:hypothetical protein